VFLRRTVSGGLKWGAMLATVSSSGGPPFPAVSSAIYEAADEIDESGCTTAPVTLNRVRESNPAHGWPDTVTIEGPV
jgi:hypothetical protein